MSAQFNNLSDVEEFLDAVPKFNKAGLSAANFDLKRMARFCDHMGNPQTNVRFIHVAGTNGKGTVCRMLASVYQEAGYSVGLYTSPHLIDFRERFQINGTYIDESSLIEFFGHYGDYIKSKSFTYFEITTAIAFWYFSIKRVDVAILEVGLGGRLDATNVVRPLISVIVSIGMDHTDILGDNLEKIAFEKAGIIKSHSPVVVGHLDESVRSVIRGIADEKSSDFITIDSLCAAYTDQKILLSGDDAQIVINAENWKSVDAANAAIVYCVIERLNDLCSVNITQLVKGIENVANRFQRRAVFEKLIPGENWYFDGAHNTTAVESLTSHMRSMGDFCEWTAVLSFMDDKLNSEIANIWNKFGTIYIYQMDGERAATIDEMFTYFPSAKVFNPSRQLISNQFKSELVIFSGSFYFYSIVSNWMGAIASADQLNPPAL